jgi:hypothetical protein
MSLSHNNPYIRRQTMSAIGIIAVAFDSTGKRFNSMSATPQVKDFIESCSPPQSMSVKDGGKWIKIDTSDIYCLATAAPRIQLPSGEWREFSYWLMKPETGIEQFPSLMNILHQGQQGIFGLYYGVPKLPKLPKPWPLDATKFLAWLEKAGVPPSWDKSIPWIFPTKSEASREKS